MPRLKIIRQIFPDRLAQCFCSVAASKPRTRQLTDLFRMPLNISYIVISLLFGNLVFADDILPRIVGTIIEEEKTLVVDDQGRTYESTIVPEIQSGLEIFLAGRGRPIASVVMVEVATGKILAMAEGRSYKDMGLSGHSALFGELPAASLFKMVVAASAIELAFVDPYKDFGLSSGCRNVKTSAVWLDDQINRSRKMSMKKAFGQSCNDFFAKIAVNQVGLHGIKVFAEKFGFGRAIPADFDMGISPIQAPSVEAASVIGVGRFAAGFGRVGLSAAHAAWMSLILAREGLGVPLHLFEGGQSPDPKINLERIISVRTAETMRGMMDASIMGGTASFAFRRGKYRSLRTQVGGKTGTLSSQNPEGIATWFSGMMPLSDPKVVVGAVVLLEDLWHIKGPNLAAEALYLYDQHMRQHEASVASSHH